MRSTLESHRSYARESHGKRIGCVHRNRKGYAQATCMGISQDEHVGSGMKRDSPVFLTMFFTTKN